MLIDYIQGAMRHAQFEPMEDGRIFATIPQCRGLWAEGDTKDACHAELRSALEDWLMVKMREGDTFEVIDGVDINPKPEHAQAH